MSENKEPLNLLRNKREIALVLPSNTTEFSIRLIDWKRIYRRIKSIPRKSPIFLTAAGILFGTGATAIFSLVPLYQATQNVEPWVKPVYWIIGFAAILLGGITTYFCKETDKVVKSSCLEVQQDMKEIHSLYFLHDKLNSD